VVVSLALLVAGGVDAAPRHRPAPDWRLRKLQNLRDAGVLAGLPTGRIYRSDDPRNRPFEVCGRLRALGIRTIVKLNGRQRTLDLTHRPTWGKGPCGLPELTASLPYNRTAGAAGVNVYHLGDRPDDPAKRAVVDYQRRQVAAVLAELSRLKESQVPVLIHCSLGRDRTGVVVALLQRLAGASREAVERDYLESLRTVGKISVTSLQRTLRRMPDVHEFLRQELGLSWWTLHLLRKVVLGPKAAARPR
jgi:protein-tyrosine phosphatase